MLTIRKHQIAVLEDDRRRIFAQSSQTILERLFPDRSSKLGDKAMCALVNEGIRRAELRNLRSEQEVLYYLGLMFALGVDYHESHEPPWAVELLERETHSPMANLEEIYQRITAQSHLRGLGAREDVQA